MMHGTKSLENDRCTFGGRDRTPHLGVEVATEVVEGAVTDEMLTCVQDGLVRHMREISEAIPENPSIQPNIRDHLQPPPLQSGHWAPHPRRWRFRIMRRPGLHGGQPFNQTGEMFEIGRSPEMRRSAIRGTKSWLGGRTDSSSLL